MDRLTVEEWQLLSFFEVEPTLQDQDVPWCYNDALYEVVRGELKLSFAVAPAYRDLRVILKHRDQKVYELNSMNVKDVVYDKSNGKERLTVQLCDHANIILSLRPSIELSHEVNGQRS